MFTHEFAQRLRRLLLTASVACSLVLGAAMVTPAVADTPEAWEPPSDVSGLEYVMLLLIIPLGIAAVLTLLTVLPSLARDRGHEPGRSWRGESQWFGGPTKGVASAEQVTPDQLESRTKDTGSTSASW